MSDPFREKTVNAEDIACFDAYMKAGKKMIDEALERYLPDRGDYPPLIFEAMRYSIFAGGKRIRPILCLATMEVLGAPELRTAALPAACALEMIHTYSLIHDDLPAMDNDDCRRGIPTSHRKFGEDIAILAGDALLTEAFHLMARRELTELIPAERVMAVIREVAWAAGCYGMIGGQVMDIRSERTSVDAETLYYIHSRKTGAMILASIKSGALMCGTSQEKMNALSAYGRSIGLAFQIVDDILNVEGDRLTTGKSTGSDASRGKVTFPAFFGLESSREKARKLVDQAIADLSLFEESASPLRMLARHLLERKS